MLMLLSLFYYFVERFDDDDGLGLGFVTEDSIDDVVWMHDELGSVRLAVD